MRPGRLFKLRGIEHLHRSLFAIRADRCGTDPAAADLRVLELAVSKLGHVVLEAPVRDLSANTAGDGRWTGGNRGNGLAGERSAVSGGDPAEGAAHKPDRAAGTHAGTAVYHSVAYIGIALEAIGKSGGNPGSRACRRTARGSGATEDTACRSRPAADTTEHSRRHHHLHCHTGPGLGDV